MQTAFNAGQRCKKNRSPPRLASLKLLKRSKERLGLIGEGIFCFKHGADGGRRSVFVKSGEGICFKQGADKGSEGGVSCL